MSDSPELPVVYTLWQCSGCGIVRETEADIMTHLGETEKYDERPVEILLTKMSDAEDAIQEARQHERQRILNKLKFEEYFEFENKSEQFNQGFRKALEELRDDLQGDLDE